MRGDQCACLVLLCLTFNHVGAQNCKNRNAFQDESICGKCNVHRNSCNERFSVAGRRFFIRFDQIPAMKTILTKKELLQPYAYPWIANILGFYGPNIIACTGTLINDRYVITAQNPVKPPLQPQHFRVALGYPLPHGSNALSSQVRRVLRIILHPFFDSSNVATAENNIALLRIQPVIYQKTVYPVHLPGIIDKYTFRDAPAENVGFNHALAPLPGGAVKPTSGFYKTPVQIISNEMCRNYNDLYRAAVTPSVICTATPAQVQKDTCTGDIGAPLLVENHKRIFNISILLGVLSWSHPQNKQCILNGSPVLYVPVADKVEWILANTKDALYCKF